MIDWALDRSALDVHASQVGRRGLDGSRARLEDKAAKKNADLIRRKPEEVLRILPDERSVFDRHDIARTILSVPEQYSPIVPFESSPGAAAAGFPGRAPADQRGVIVNTPSDGRRGILVIKLRETIMILELHQQGLTVSANSRETRIDRKTVRKYTERGPEVPAYGPRKPRATVIDPFASYLRERVKTYPGLTGSRLLRELRDRGYAGSYTAVTDFLRNVRPPANLGFEVRFETPPGEQAQVDFAQFHVVFTDEPMTPRIVWLFSMVLGHSRLIWARFVMHQNLPTVLRCHIAAFEAIGGAPREVLYDRMKTAVIGEGQTEGIIYNRALIDLARHYGLHPKACKAYRAKTKGKVERPFRYIREDFFLARSFRNLDDMNAQLRHWLDTVANPRKHATTQLVVNEAFAEERPHLRPPPWHRSNPF